MVDFANRRWIIEKTNLNFGRNGFLPLIVLAFYLEVVLDL